MTSTWSIHPHRDPSVCSGKCKRPEVNLMQVSPPGTASISTDIGTSYAFCPGE